MDRNMLFSVIYEQQRDFLTETAPLVPRELTGEILPLLRHRLPIIITGVRRAGKSTLLRLLQKELQLSQDSFLYLNFNDERLINFNPDDFQRVLDYTIEQGYQKNCTFFIDEIQEVQHWEKWVDRLKEKHPLVITGSNSKLLSKEISTVLTGRSINLSLYPFSFREFLALKKIDHHNSALDKGLQAKLRREFSLFLQRGGIPKVIVEDNDLLLAELYENIIYRDIIGRFTPRLEKAIKEMSLFLLSNISKEFSLRGISQATGISNLSTVKSVIDTFEKAFLFFFIPKYDYSLRKQLQNPRKEYVIDNGLAHKVGFHFSEDKGRLLENLVFLELKRRGKQVYYSSGKGECDFLTREGVKITGAIQVCYELHAENKERKLFGLREAMEKFKVKKGLVLTFDQEETVQGKIEVIPTWKWLLQK